MINRKDGCVICSERTWGHYGKWLDPTTKRFVYYWVCGWCRGCISVSRAEVWPKLPADYIKEDKMKGLVDIRCDGIMCKSVYQVEIPDWMGETEFGQEGHCLFCPNCTRQSLWFSAVCPGCVESYPDCDLSKSFAWAQQRTITDDDKNIIHSGYCPFRTNGTLGVQLRGTRLEIEALDLSKVAPAECGQAIVEAINAYSVAFPGED